MKNRTNQITKFMAVVMACLFTFTVFAEQEKNILPASEVFSPQVTLVSSKEIVIEIDIPDNYYIYKNRSFELNFQNKDLIIEKLILSKGYLKEDRFFGKQDVWYGGKQNAKITAKYKNPKNILKTNLKLKLQACIDGAICYPPEVFDVPVSFTKVINKKNDEKSSLSSLISKDKKVNLFGEKTLLEADDAFSFFVELSSPTEIIINWKVADDYYLYRDKIVIKSQSKDIANIIHTQGLEHNDEYFGKQQIYRQNQGKSIIYLKKANKRLKLNLEYQGCSDSKICYPIVYKNTELDTTLEVYNNRSASLKLDLATGSENTENNKSQTIVNEQDKLTKILLNKRVFSIIWLFSLGLLLAFTVCVLPMVPIILAIINNQQNITKPRSALLSSVYVLGMATMMAVFGLIVASFNINLQIIFQKPLFLIIFAGLFLVMSLAMFGVFSISMPSFLQTKINNLQNKVKNTSLFNLFIMGALSALVVGPCIAPPLLAVLAFISTTDNYILGGVYLFVLGLGMGAPLIFFAVFSTLIPKTGEFSKFVSKFLATIILGVAFWLLSRLLPSSLNMVIWGIYLFGLAFVIAKPKYKLKTIKIFKNILVILLISLSITWIAGGVTGHKNILKPFSQSVLKFKYINNEAELIAELKNSNKPIMLDLYADWCVSCKELENIMFFDEKVIEKLSEFKLLKLDITKTNDEHKVFMKKYNLVGPPVLMFFDNNKELKNHRLQGLPSIKQLIQSAKIN